MKRIFLASCLWVPLFLFAQYQSWNGQGMTSCAHMRCLYIFVNIIYDVHPEAENIFPNQKYWPSVTDPSQEGINNTAIPVYLLDWMDTSYVPGHLHGSCTRLYGESSFDSLQITGDFVVVNILESTVLKRGSFSLYNITISSLQAINEKGLSTLYGHNTIEDYDDNHDGKLDFVNLLIRNITKKYGGLNRGSGYGSFSGSLTINGNTYSFSKGTRQCVGDVDFVANPTNIVTHEISHTLFGGNSFHTSGGNHRYSDGTVMPFLNLQGGYGLMGAANSGLVCCNGYERWRMHWKHPQAVDYISARDSANTLSVISDITREDGNQTFLLRDFITYGDAIRIKLPYKDNETSSNQYIWLENHQIGRNDKLDFLQYSNTYDCRPAGSPGIYAYYQIGRDILEGDHNVVYDDQHRDNLKIIPAEGFYDFEMAGASYRLDCVTDKQFDYVLIRTEANPFCGGQDQAWHLFPSEEDTILYTTREFAMWRKNIGTQSYDNLPFLGDTLDAFTTHTRLNMGTNPSTCNTITFHSTNKNPNTIIRSKSPEKNVRTTYLTGLGIEMIPVGNTGNILVRIRWNDYDIIDDPRWTGRIALRDTAVLAAKHSLLLAQNCTVSQPTRDPETGLFAGKTSLTCQEGSLFLQQPESHVILTENSTLTLDSNSHYELVGDAQLHICQGCTLVAQNGSQFHLLDSACVVVDSLGCLILNDTVVIGPKARIILRAGGTLVANQPIIQQHIHQIKQTANHVPPKRIVRKRTKFRIKRAMSFLQN